MSQLDQSLLIFFIVYVLAVIGISLYRTNRAQEMADQVLAGRNVGPITTGLSAASSLERSWVLIVFPAVAAGFRAFVVTLVVSAAVGLWLSWRLIGPRLRRYTFAAQNSLTLPEFLERRFNDHTGILRVLAAVLTLMFVLFYVSAGIMAGGLLFNAAFDLNEGIGGIITIVVVLAYVFIGGYVVIARTDVFQSIIVLVGLVVLAIGLFAVADEPTRGVADTFRASFTDTYAWMTDDAPGYFVFLYIFSSVCIAFSFAQGAFGAQRLLQRFMAAKDESIMNTSRRISASWISAVFVLSVLAALFALNALPTEEATRLEATLRGGDVFRTDVGLTLYYDAAALIANPVVGAIALTALIAAVMSTTDSQMLIGASVATSDLPFVRNYAQRKRFEYALGAYMRVWIGRGMLVLIALLAWILAQFQPNSIIAFLAYAWAGMGCTFGPLVFLSLYWRRFNIQGAIASLLVGGLLTLVCAVLGLAFPWFVFFSALVLPVAVVVTLVTPAPSAAVQEQFDLVVGETETA